MKIHGWLLVGSLLVLPGPLFGQGLPSPEEMQRERAATFNEADADGDGALSLDEFRTFESSLHQKMAQHFEEANGEGTAPPPLPPMDPEQHLKQLDANGDGVVTLDELQAARPHFGPRKPPRF